LAQYLEANIPLDVLTRVDLFKDQFLKLSLAVEEVLKSGEDLIAEIWQALTVQLNNSSQESDQSKWEELIRDVAHLCLQLEMPRQRIDTEHVGEKIKQQCPHYAPFNEHAHDDWNDDNDGDISQN
jgi:hypothetical protein